MRAQSVVVAAGVDTPVLLAPLGIELPIEPEYGGSSSRVRFASVSSSRSSSRRSGASPRSSLPTGACWRAISPRRASNSDADAPRWREAVRRSIRELLPVLEYVDFAVLARGVYDSTPDRQAIIGPVLGYEGLWVA